MAAAHATKDTPATKKRGTRTVLARGKKRDPHWGRKWGRT